MIAININSNRGVFVVSVSGSNAELQSPVGQLVSSEAKALGEKINAFIAAPPEKKAHKKESPAETKDAPPSDETTKNAADALKEQVEKTGGIQTTPPSSGPMGQTTEDSGGIKITGGDNDPATKQPQPGDDKHVIDPNENTDPVDSNPPPSGGEENAKSPKEPSAGATTAKPAVKSASKKGGGSILKPKSK